MPSMTPLEARVIDSVFSRKDFSDGTSLKQVAGEAGVSEAMVVKIAKKLGFSGYRDFRENVARYVRLTVEEMQEELSPADTAREIIHKVFRASMQALEETLAIADVEAFERAAGFIHAARQRDLYGVGGSAQIARDVAHKFLRNRRSHRHVRRCAHDVHVRFAPGTGRRRDRILSYGRHARGHRSAATGSQKRGSGMIAVTNYLGSPIAELADVVLCSTARGSPLLGENAAARIAQLNILDAIFVLVAQRARAVAERNLSRTMDAVRSKRKA